MASLSIKNLIKSAERHLQYLTPIFCAILLWTTNASSSERITLLLDWFVNPDHGPIVIAQQKGFFNNLDLDVEIIEPSDPNDPPKLVAAGKADLAISYQPQLHLQVDADLPLVRVATLISTPLMTLLTLEDGKITTLSDLKGRKIGFSVGGFEDVMLKTMFAPHGFGLADVELINVNFALSPALISGQVDAVIGAYRNFELNQLEILGKKGRAFYVEEEGVPSYDELIIIANRANYRDKKITKFVEALERGVQYLVNHPKNSWDLFKNYKKGLDDELNRRAWRDTLSRFALRPGAMDKARYKRFGEFLLKHGLINAVPELKVYAVELER